MTLFTDEIERLVRHDSIAKKYFKGVFPADCLPNINTFPYGIIINLDDSNEPGSHWVGLWISELGHAIYFDSYGLPPLRPSILAFVSKYEWVHNTKAYQHMTSEDCGYYTILFILLSSRKYTLDDIQYLFYENKGRLNDILVKDYIQYFIT